MGHGPKLPNNELGFDLDDKTHQVLLDHLKGRVSTDDAKKEIDRVFGDKALSTILAKTSGETTILTPAGLVRLSSSAVSQVLKT